ncbi:magnesium chelatase [Trinickia dinghuensis]|uniref:Magnesium chelatase n=1 Tax=Trinickia dinghuensis TaxID=2291023 RepID=A0A3D8JUU5_9BURK|nr:magnesium chelatase [Trinickia dinghuensis]
MPPPFPLSALIGQDALREALLLVAVDPSIGGLLVSGPRGTAKSTAARSLAELLPDGHFVTLPLGASEERVVGTLNLDEVLRGGEVKFSPGLLARANDGVLYVDEVNLLADGLVDVVLDAAASGINVVERDGISHSHVARFVLIGTMNPEEGELRPQLLDRFGLMVQLENCFDAEIRQRIVKARMAFDLDPDAFRRSYAPAQQDLAQRIRQARTVLPDLPFADDVHDAVSTRCIEAAVDGLRADLVMLRAARALAALESAETVTSTHVERVADLVLRHRRHQPEQGASDGGTDSMQAGKAGNGKEPSDDRQSQSTEAATNQRPSDGASQDDPDWGYLPPEPAGMLNVKGVIPLSTKKR